MRLLIIEDEEGIARFLREGLEEENFTVDLATNGNQGLEMALSDEANYDLLLIDWMLPGVSGLEICKAFREKNVTTPIIFLTAKDKVEETVYALEAGANDYIKKPFDFDELLARIRVQLRPSPQEHDTLKLQDLELNLSTHQLFQSGQPIELTQKEFDLLEYLIRKKGTVCTRTEIIQKVWNIHFDYDTAVIDVYINFLRKKLNYRSERKYIKTIRGVGYMAIEK